MYMDNFIRFTLITVFCFMGLAGCDSGGLNDEQAEARTIETYSIVNSSLLDLNVYFLLADSSISALHLLNAQEGTIDANCMYGGDFTVTLDDNTLNMEFHDCSTEELSKVNGMLILELAELEQQGYLLAFNSKMYSKNMSWSDCCDYNPTLRDDFDAELIQTITGNHSTLTTLNFSEKTQVFNDIRNNLSETSNMSYQRQLDYETGIYTIAYDGHITRFNDQEVSVFITTPEPIQSVHREGFLSGGFVIDDGKSHINASFSKSSNSRYFFDVAAEYNQGGSYQTIFAAPFAHKPEIFHFTSRSGNLSKYVYFYGDELNANDKAYYEHLSLNGGNLQTSAQVNSQVSVSLAVLPIFNNLGQFTVLVTDRGTKTEINPELYTVALEELWVKISFDSSLSTDSIYTVKLTDDSGREVIHTTVYPIDMD